MSEIFFPYAIRGDDPNAALLVQQNLEHLARILQRGGAEGDILTWSEDVQRFIAGDIQIPNYRHYIITSENTNANTHQQFGDLTTVGPELTDLPDGKYLFIFGAHSSVTTTNTRREMGLSINAAPVDEAEIVVWLTGELGIRHWVYSVELAGGTNDVVAKYKVNSATNDGLWNRRHLFGLKLS